MRLTDQVAAAAARHVTLVGIALMIIVAAVVVETIH